MQRHVANVGPVTKLDAGFAGDMREQRALQVGAVER